MKPICGRCRIRVQPKLLVEFCWYCGADLCYGCWEKHGHCGHPEAAEANKRGAKVKQPRATT